MTILNTENSTILIIDIQEKLLNAVYNKEDIRKNCRILAKVSDILNIPVIITEQYPKGLGYTINEIKENLRENNYKIFEKTSFSALCDDTFVNYLNGLNRKNIILCGIETHICVYQTASALIEKGYNVVLAKNISSSRAETEHLSAIEVLKQDGIRAKTLEMILFELLKTSKHPNFKEIQALIK